MGEKNKPKVLIVHNYYQIPGGEDTVVANEKRLLEKYGHEVFLYTRNNSELKKMSVFRKLLLPFTTIYNPGTVRDVRKIIEEKKIDIVHVHNTLNLISPSVYYVAQKCNVPVVQTIHNFRMLCPGAAFYRDGHICEDCVEKGLRCAVQYKCYRGSRLQTLVCVICMKFHRMTGIYKKINYICLTEFNRNKLLLLNRVTKKELIERDRVFVKPNFTFDTGCIQENKTGIKEYYIFIGRIEKIKGIDVLLSAFARLPKQKLMIVGTGNELEKYKDAAKKGGLSNILFTGFMNQEKICKVISKAKAVIVPSQWYEGFPMILVEAFANEVPVIAGNVGNIGSLVEDGVNGIIFQYNSTVSLIHAVQRFEKENRVEMGKDAYKTYETKFSDRQNYSILSDIYCAISERKVASC